MAPKNIEIDGRKIGPDYPPYIIAELSGNHNGDIDRAKKLIDVAKEAGADAVKLQTYTADSLSIDTDREEFIIRGNVWEGRNLYQLYQEAHTPWDWLPELYAHAGRAEITIFSSPFDKKAVQVLESLNSPAYKIASNEFVDWPLVEASAKTGKPLIMSTGAASRHDVTKTVDFVRTLGVRDLVILHCVSAYPAPAETANIRTLVDIRDSFGVLAGFSDHTLGTQASVAAVALGAVMIEKHITLDRNDGGPDSSFSLEPLELKRLCEEARWAWAGLGRVCYGGETDLKAKGIFTRQYCTLADIRKGDILLDEYRAEEGPVNIKSIRAPRDWGGLPTTDYRNIVGRPAAHDIPKHSPLTAEDLGE